MKALPDFKRGDTFALACTYKIDGVPTPISGLTIASQIRTIAGDLVASLAYAPSDQAAAPGQFTLSAASTAAWPIAGLRCDIQITDGAVILSSDTFLVPVVQDITQ